MIERYEVTPAENSQSILGRWLPPLGLFLLILMGWQALTSFGDIKPYLLPSPLAVARAGWVDGWTLLRAAYVTGQAALGGFLLSLVIGYSSAILFAQFPLARRGVLPYAVFLQTVPMIAIAPLIITWLGPGQQSVVLISLIVSLFPIITTATSGLLSVTDELHDLFELYGASSWQRLIKLSVPQSMPYVVAGAKTSAGLAVIGAIVGEFFAGNFSGSQGLGFV
ncbi:MAG: ABC transporter permease, partial [Pirellulaceae bacterium]